MNVRIVIEGAQGSGKSTFAAYLRRILKDAYRQLEADGVLKYHPRPRVITRTLKK